MSRYLVVLTEIRPLRRDGEWRDERTRPEKRRQVVAATDRAAAERIATAFQAFGMVRAGRQRVKILLVDRPPEERSAPGRGVEPHADTLVPRHPERPDGRPG